jgi:hypothetical protein
MAHLEVVMPVQTDMLVDSAGVVRYRLASALPTGSFDGPALQATIDRP